MSDKRRVIFVDDEPRVLDGLRRMLHPMRHELEMAFATSGREALEILSRDSFDVIVTDMRMPGMSGAELLYEVITLYPWMVRIILSGQAGREEILRAVGPVHQYLSKPCEAETLKTTLARACALSDLLGNQKIKQLVSQMKTLPSLPSLYSRIVEEIQSPEASTKTLGQIIEQDMAMSAKVLQLVNSAFFGLRQRISRPEQAVIYLGLDTVTILVLSVGIFSQIKEPDLKSLSLQSLWSHSITVAAFAKRIAETESSDRQLIGFAFSAGLLHDVGKLVLATNLAQEYTAALTLADRNNISLSEAEHRIIGASHADVGAYLLGLWGLPEPIVLATAFHDLPIKYMDKDFTPLTAVHFANMLERELYPGQALGNGPTLDMTYLSCLGLSERYSAWREICGGADLKEETQ